MGWEVIGTIALVVLVVLFLGRKNIMRLFGAGRAQATKMAKAAENADPQARLQMEIDNATDRLQSARQGVEKFKGYVNRLTRQVQVGGQNVVKLQTRVDYWIENNDETKGAEAFARLDREKSDLSENEAQLNQAKKDYQAQFEEMKAANRAIASAEQRGRSMGAQLELAKARKEAMALTNQVGLGGGSALSGGLANGLANAETAIQQQIDDTNASAEVTSDLSADARSDAAAEAEIEAAQSKSKFAEYMAAKKAESARDATEADEDTSGTGAKKAAK